MPRLLLVGLLEARLVDAHQADGDECERHDVGCPGVQGRHEVVELVLQWRDSKVGEGIQKTENKVQPCSLQATDLIHHTICFMQYLQKHEEAAEDELSR